MGFQMLLPEYIASALEVFIFFKPYLESSKFDTKALLIHLVVHLFIQHWKLLLQGIIIAHMGNTKFGGFLVQRGERNILGRKKGTPVR